MEKIAEALDHRTFAEGALTRLLMRVPASLLAQIDAHRGRLQEAIRGSPSTERCGPRLAHESPAGSRRRSGARAPGAPVATGERQTTAACGSVWHPAASADAVTRAPGRIHAGGGAGALGLSQGSGAHHPEHGAGWATAPCPERRLYGRAPTDHTSSLVWSSTGFIFPHTVYRYGRTRSVCVLNAAAA